MADDAIYATRIFLNAALPLLKPIVEAKSGLAKSFKGKSGVVQVSALLGPHEAEYEALFGETAPAKAAPAKAGPAKAGPAKAGTHFLVEDGVLTVAKGLHASPNVELEFPSLEALNGFFSGKSKKLPKMKGAFASPGLFVATMKALLSMASALGAKSAPAEEGERDLLVKLYFYLLSSGISQLNKAGHPAVAKWAKTSPDRVYAWAVEGKPELSAYVRVKAGNTRAARGVYERSKPFFTMSFDSSASALGILLGTDDMIESTATSKICMLGAPEFGAMLGDLMQLVANFAK
jgi:hypothetical protein